jgi:hypothetical protein
MYCRGDAAQNTQARLREPFADLEVDQETVNELKD